MKNKYFKISLLVLFCCIGITGYTQNTLIAEITGNPANTTGWDLINDTSIDGEDVVLTEALNGQYGAIYYSESYALAECNQWSVEFDFRIFDSNNAEPADGLAFWYIDTPPTNFAQGETIGIPNNSNGLKIAFDTYDNDNNVGGTDNPEIQVGFGPEFSEADPNNYLLRSPVIPGLRSNDYQHAVINWTSGNVQVIIDGVTYIDGVPPAQPGANAFEEGYFGFSASTGAFNDRHSIKNVEVYVSAVILESNNESITLCDNDGDGFESFDLTSVQDQIYVDPSVGFIYYPTEVDALAGNANFIADPTNYTNTTANTDDTAYVRVLNAFGCFGVAEIDLLLENVDLLDDSINVIGDCDDDLDQIVNFNLNDYSTSFITNTTDYNLSFYTDLTAAQDEDASALITNSTSYGVTAGDTETVYIRVEDPITGCFSIGEINLETSPSPQISSLQDLNQCFSAGQNLVFDLTVNTANILGSQDPNLFTVTYHTSQASAINDGNSIIFPTQFTLNTAGCQTLYVRIESNTNSTCFSVSDFQVCANAVSLGSVSDLNACNNSIDLTANEADLLNGENPNNYNISYHNSQADADGNSNEITNISAFDGCQTIYVRVESINDVSCYQTESFEACALFVNPGTPINLNACSGNDLPTTFDLTQNESNILNGNSFNISYFESLAEAENNQNAITTTNNYQALNDTQTIYVRVENTNDANCYSIVTYDIETFYGGLTTNEVSLTLCTEELNNPIDLTASEDQLGLNTDESIDGYYSTLTDATNQTNPIDNPTNYSGGNNQEFYIRIENNNPSICYAITRLVIEDEICELFIPEGFSPNADGINDNFEISGLYKNYNFDLKIYSRYGRLVYEGNNNRSPWNGSYEGNALPTGTYFYVLDINSPDSRNYKGWVYLNK